MSSSQSAARRSRRRMVKFTLDEISLVDHPAQAGARVLITKRRDDADDLPDALRREVRKCGDMVRGYDAVLADAARAFAKKGEDFYDAYHRLAHEHSPEGDAFRKTLAHRDDAQRLAAEKVGATYRSDAPAHSNSAVRKNGQFAKVADVDAELDALAHRRALPGEPHLDAYCRLMGESSPSGDEFRGLIEKRDEAYRRAVG